VTIRPAAPAEHNTQPINGVGTRPRVPRAMRREWKAINKAVGRLNAPRTDGSEKIRSVH